MTHVTAITEIEDRSRYRSHGHLGRRAFPSSFDPHVCHSLFLSLSLFLILLTFFSPLFLAAFSFAFQFPLSSPLSHHTLSATRCLTQRFEPSNPP